MPDRTQTADLPFWSDDFDMDLPKILPEARDLLGSLAGVELVTTGRPDERTGRLNHPAVWNHDQGVVAYFGFKSPRRPAYMVAPDTGDIRCTAWEALRDAWPHGYLMIVEGRLVWNTFGLEDSFATIMFHLRGWRHDPHADAAARRLVADSVPPRILEAYYAAGGTVTESLFEEDRYIDDAALLKKVRADAIEAERQRLLGQGWAWVALDEELPAAWRWSWEKIHEHVEPIYTAEEEARAGELDAQLAANKLSAEDAYAAEIEIDALVRRAQERAYTPEERARSGVVITAFGNEFELALGIIRPEGEEAAPAASDADEDWGTDATGPESDETSDAAAPESVAAKAESEKYAPGISNALLESLTTTLTLAAQRAIAADPSLALRAAVAGLMADPWVNPVKISVTGYQATASADIGRRPFPAAFASLAGLSEADLMTRLATQVSRALDLRKHNAQSDRSASEALRDALPADAYLAAARELFNAADYFNRAPKAISEAALAEMGCPVMSGAKKADLAAMAAARAKATGWLPPELRHPAYRLLTEEEVAA